MHPIDHLYNLFDENVDRAKKSYNLEPKEKDTRTMRSSSINNGLQNIQKQIEKEMRGSG